MDEINTAQERLVLFGQARRRTFLDQLYHAVIAVDLELLRRVRRAGRRLKYRHPMGQNLAHSTFLLADRAGIETILHRRPSAMTPMAKMATPSRTSSQSERGLGPSAESTA